LKQSTPDTGVRVPPDILQEELQPIEGLVLESRVECREGSTNDGSLLLNKSLHREHGHA
jgi:hypothetical protein